MRPLHFAPFRKYHTILQSKGVLRACCGVSLPPQVPHFGNRGEGVQLVPGMVFTIEPMINLGGHELVILDDQWTAMTKDHSLSAQFKQTILVTEKGFESMTPYPL